jgi:hypothetical protein
MSILVNLSYVRRSDLSLTFSFQKKAKQIVKTFIDIETTDKYHFVQNATCQTALEKSATILGHDIQKYIGVYGLCACVG